MMTVQIDFWHILGFVTMLLGAFWGLIKIIVWQFNGDLQRRFESMEDMRKSTATTDAERFDKIETMHRAHERDFLNLKAELPEKYVRREDAIRAETLVNAKLDGLALRLDTVLRNQKNE